MAMTSGATTMARATVMTTVMTTAMAAMAAMVAMARAVWCRHGSASARAAEPFPRRELEAERAKEPVATGVVAVFLGVKIRGDLWLSWKMGEWTHLGRVFLFEFNIEGHTFVGVVLIC